MKALRTPLAAFLLLVVILSFTILPAQSATPETRSLRFQINPIGFVDQYNLQSSSLEVRGNLLFSGYTHFAIADISNPDQIKVLDRLYNTHYIYDMVIDGQYAYTAMQDFGVYNLDILVNAISEFTPVNFKSSALGLSLADGVLYAANGTKGVHILDATKPADLTGLGLIKAPGNSVGVAAAGKMVFIASGYDGVRIYDATNPQTPLELKRVDTPGYATSISVENSLAYVADGAGGVRILDVKDPKNAQEIGFYDTPGTATRIALRGSLVYVADGERGLTILSAETPSAPLLLAVYRTNGSAVDVALKDNLIFLSNMPNGVLALSWTPPATKTGLDQGGTLETETDHVRYTFPSGAVAAGASVTHQALYRSAAPDGDDFHVKIGPFFSLYGAIPTAGDIPLAAPVKVSLPYDTSMVISRLEPALGLYSWTGTTWVLVPDCKVDLQAKTISASIDQFGVYGILRDRRTVIKSQ